MRGGVSLENSRNDYQMFHELLFQHRRMGKAVYSFGEKVCEQWPDLHVMQLLNLNRVRCRNGYGDRINVSDLMRDTRELPQSISRNLRILEQEGLIERHADAQDRRKTYVLYTAKGKKILEECGRQTKQLEAEVLQYYDEERMEILCREYAELIRAMEIAVGTLSGEAVQEGSMNQASEQSRREYVSAAKTPLVSGQVKASLSATEKTGRLPAAGPASVSIKSPATSRLTAESRPSLRKADPAPAKLPKESKEIKDSKESKDAKGKKTKSKKDSKGDKAEKTKKKKGSL